MNGVSLARLMEFLNEVHEQLNEIEDFCNSSASYNERYCYAKGKIEVITSLLPLALPNDDEFTKEIKKNHNEF